MTAKRLIALAALTASLVFAACAPAAPPAATPTAAPAARVEATAAPAKPAAPAAPTAAAAQPARPASSAKVTIRAAFKAGGSTIANWVGVGKGFYKEEGLDNVEVFEGSGSPATITSVAAGQDTFGGGIDISTVLSAVSTGVPVKAVALINRYMPLSYYYYLDKPVKTPKDLAGKSIVVPQGAAVAKMTPVFLRLNGVKQDDVKLVQVSTQAVGATFRAKQADVMGGFTTGEIVAFKLDGMPVDLLLTSDYGFDVLGSALITSEKVIREQPELVRKVARGYLKGLQYMAENPDDVADMGLKFFPLLERKLLKAQILEANKLTPMDPRTKTLSPSMAKEGWERTQELLIEGGVIEKKVADVSMAFTNDFLK